MKDDRCSSRRFVPLGRLARWLLALGALTLAAHAQQTWLPAAHRHEATYDAGFVGNRGLQFQRVFAWNQGTSNPTRRGWIVSGQDENGVRMSTDYGATWSSPRLSGMFCSKIAGLYLNTDDDLFVGMGGMFAVQAFITVTDIDGIYVGDGSLLNAKRVEITRPSGPGPAAPGGAVRAFTEVNYAGNSFDRNGNFLARRPQTGGLTDAQRPIWALEQVLSSGAISYIALFKSIDGGASFSFVRELAPATYASGDDGLYHILAAKNGDIVILGKRGLWLSQDQGVTFTKEHPASGDIEITSGFFYGGSASAASGMRIGVYTENANGGVWETANIRTTSFTKPNGNAGLPANYRVWHLGGSPVNPDRLAVCTDGKPPYLSTDGGRNFTQIAENVGTGDEQNRYNVRGLVAGGHAGFHFCPTDEFKCLIPTNQTMARSIDGAATSNGNLVAGFDGMHTKGTGFDALTGDWKKILRVCQDSFVNNAKDGMHWVTAAGLGTGTTAFKDALAAAGAGTENYISGAGGVICSNTRVIAAANRNTGGQSNVMVILELDSAGQYTSYLIEASQLKSRASHSRRSPNSADVAFVGRWAISNLTASNPASIVFTDHGGHEIFDCFLNAGTLVSYWMNVGPGTPNGTAIYRSTHATGNNNQTTPWYTLPTSAFGDRAICADHHTAERVLYVRNDNRDVIREIKRVNGTLQDTVLVNLRTMSGGILDTLNAEHGSTVTVPAGSTAITGLIADPNQSGVFYAIAGLHGMPNWWRTVNNGVTWTNISGNAPRTFWTGVIHPRTGEVMGFSSMGEHIHKSPSTYPALANRDALSNQIVDFMGNAQPVSVFGSNEDIGSPGQPGSALYDNGARTFTVTGGGADIWNTSDQFRFVHQPWSGDGQVVARVTAVENTHAWAKVGVMFRESTAANSKYALLALSASNGTAMENRATAGAASTQVANVSGISAPYWLRIERHGNTFTGWQSPDGLTWFLTGGVNFTMNSAARLGLAVTAHNNATLNTSTFDNLTVSKVPVWTGVDIGSVGAAGSSSVSYMTDVFTVSGAGTNVFGTADSFRFHYQAWSGDMTIIAEVTSLENTHANAKGGLMIRQSLTNNSAHALINLMGGGGVEFLRRTTSGGTTGRDLSTGVTTPRFLKLVRSGNSFTAFHSANGTAWTQLGGAVSIPMTGTVYVGLASCSIINTSNLSTSTFESVYVK